MCYDGDAAAYATIPIGVAHAWSEQQETELTSQSNSRLTNGFFSACRMEVTVSKRVFDQHLPDAWSLGSEASSFDSGFDGR
jgi:hypothetical protein